jgi:hypothetical protein
MQCAMAYASTANTDSAASPPCEVGLGTHISGIIGAIDNAEGVRGVIGQGVRIHAHAAFNETAYGYDSQVRVLLTNICTGSWPSAVSVWLRFWR